MRAVVVVLGTAVTNLLVSAMAAFADSSLPEPDDPIVRGEVVRPPGGTAFTGEDILPLAAVALLLLVVGITLLAIGRLRSASAA